VAGGVAFADRIGLDPVVLAGHGDTAVPGIRNPLTFSASNPRYDLPPPELDEHGERIRAWLAGPAS
jgi:crotonobetainyl-CoA:carnitine CoA-transferase CaiB-like acyl-CoA transferase